MVITTRSEYGMRAMLLMATSGSSTRTSSTKLAEQAKLPKKYLEQILRDLKLAGLLLSHPGVHGGYQLSRSATLITAGEVIRALDEMTVMNCVGDATPTQSCDQFLGCSLRPLWQRLYEAMHEVLDSTTLQQLTEGSCVATLTQASTVPRS